jgi:SAM-dependent methyltransferase
LPASLRRRLFGDREKHGLSPKTEDPSWVEWQARYVDFYQENQKVSIGSVVNDAGYRVMRKQRLSGSAVLEMGPGDIRHHLEWCDKPRRFVVADVLDEMLVATREKLARAGITCETRLLKSREDHCLPFADAEFDFVVSFYSLEHLHPLGLFLAEIARVLKPGGRLIGAIPCEGGVGWGLGRMLTSRRWLRKNTTIDPDKIICWEHPNFARDILLELDKCWIRRELDFWPCALPVIDLNLVARFVYERPLHPPIGSATAGHTT